MKLLKFIAWWWNKLDKQEKVMTGIIAVVLSIFPGLYFFGAKFLLFVIGAILGGMFTALLRMLWKSVKNQCIYTIKNLSEKQMLLSIACEAELDLKQASKLH